jgi:hypothetical protein
MLILLLSAAVAALVAHFTGSVFLCLCGFVAALAVFGGSLPHVLPVVAGVVVFVLTGSWVTAPGAYFIVLVMSCLMYAWSLTLMDCAKQEWRQT